MACARHPERRRRCRLRHLNHLKDLLVYRRNHRCSVHDRRASTSHGSMAPEPVFHLDVQGKQNANDAIIPGDSQHQFHLLLEIQAAEAVPDVLVDSAVPGNLACEPDDGPLLRTEAASSAGVSPSSAWVSNQFMPLRRLAIRNGVEQGHGTQSNPLGMKDLWPSASRFWKNQARVRNGQQPSREGVPGGLGQSFGFPLPPLKFRTAGFPQYGFKWTVNGDLRRCPKA